MAYFRPFFVLVSLSLCLFREQAIASNKFFTYQGRILDSNGRPFEYEFTQFKFEITNPSGTCLLYREISATKDLRNSGGVFDVPIGEGVVDSLTPSGNTIESVFKNGVSHPCIGGGTYNAVDGNGRLLRVSFRNQFGWQLITPDQEIRGIPYATYAQNASSAARLDNFTSADFLQTANTQICGAGEFLRHIAPLGTLVCESMSAGTIGGSTTINTSGLIQTSNGLRLGNGANHVELKASAGATASYSLELPPAAGTAGNTLQVDALGRLQWVASTHDAADIVSGTIAEARLPASVKFWNTATGGINYSAGNVGIGSSTPNSKLDVAGEVKIGNSGATCSASSEGAIRYNSTSKVLEFCNGTSWSTAGGGIECTTKSLTSGSYNGTTLSCDAGWTMTGGGCTSRSDGNDNWVYDRPNGNGWFCQNNDSGLVAEVWVRCCR